MTIPSNSINDRAAALSAILTLTEDTDAALDAIADYCDDTDSVSPELAEHLAILIDDNNPEITVAADRLDDLNSQLAQRFAELVELCPDHLRDESDCLELH